MKAAFNPLQTLPQVEKLLEIKEIKTFFTVISRPVVADIISSTLDNIRNNYQNTGKIPDQDQIIGLITEKCRDTSKLSLQKVINGTGIILHTNLGRSPVDEEIWDAVKEINTGYSNLELELTTGKRGSRGSFLSMLISRLTGSESALVVNNNAAAVFLMLSSLAKGREVIVSRGEQIQIGGGFRIPEILALSGAVMVEAGTTNITTVKDYLDAVTDKTAMILAVHTSNFKIRGFAESPDISALSEIIPDNVIVAVDQGSGIINEKIKDEFSVNEYLKKGADLVCFSGDKIAGGPQAGIIAGKEKYIKILSGNPLMRTYRAGKTIHSILEKLIISKLNKNNNSAAVKALFLDEKNIKIKAVSLMSLIPEDFAELCSSTFYLGGGSTPDQAFPSWAVRLKSDKSPERLAEQLRKLDIPIICTLKNNSLLIDSAALDLKDFSYIAESVKKAVV